MFGIHCFSARTRAAVRACALLGPLAAASACDANGLKEGAPDRATVSRPLPESTATEGAPGHVVSASRHVDADDKRGTGTRAKGEEASGKNRQLANDPLASADSAPVDLNSLSVGHGVVAAARPMPATQGLSLSGPAGGGGAMRRPATSAASAAAPAVAATEAAAFGMIGLATLPRATSPGRAQADQREPVAPVLARLDPNARYATTYRPGGAALAAFDAAVSRGQIPTSYKDLVGDFGARYAPALDRPSGGALNVSVDTARAAVGPEGGPMDLLVTMASSDETPSRAPLSVHIVLDVSGSMSGQAIEDAKKAAEAAVDKLDPSDDFSMVTFSDTASVIVPDGPIGPRRAQVLSRIHAVAAGGGTNIWAGLDLGYSEARAPRAGEDAVRIVMLLSDGHANGGDTDPQHLAARAAQAFQDGIQTSSFGLGPDFDAALMSGIADRGAGGYYYVADSSQIEPALAREIDARLRPVATAVELRVRLRPDIAATHVFGSRELTAMEADAVRAQEVVVDRQEKQHGIASDREVDAAGGMRFFIPAFARDDRHATLITLQLPPGTGERRIASIEIRYKDRLLTRNVTKELPVNVRWAESDAASAATVNHNVERLEQAFAAGEAILQAAERVDTGDRAAARNLLIERAAVLRLASSNFGESRFVEDAVRLERLGDAVGGTKPMAELPLVVMLRGSGYGYL